MGRYIARRLASMMLVLLGVSTLAFVLGAMAPGDPAELFLERAIGRPPSEEQIQLMRQEMGLDRPFPVRFTRWLGGLARGDLGMSWGSGQSVSAALTATLPNTLVLAATALLASLGMAVPLGAASAAQPRSLTDHAARVAAVAAASVPAFVLGYLLMLLFGVQLGLLPVFGFGSLAHLVLPALTLSFSMTGTFTRVVRASVLAALAEPYVRAAVARGASSRQVVIGHALPNALIPLVTVAALSLGHMLGGTVIVEWIFSWPGLGKLGLDAIHNRDYPLIQGWMLFMSVVFVGSNLAADLVCAFADPRVRLEADRA